MAEVDKRPFVGDVVVIDISQADDLKHWVPLATIRGVVVHLTWMADEDVTQEPTTAQVVWTEKCGLSLHWRRENLIVVLPKQTWPDDHPVGVKPDTTMAPVTPTKGVTDGEAFTQDQVEASLRAYLDYGEQQYLKSQQGYFSGEGFAARCIRWHLNTIAAATKETKHKFNTDERTGRSPLGRPLCIYCGADESQKDRPCTR
jgi:hypothetical protein